MQSSRPTIEPFTGLPALTRPCFFISALGSCHANPIGVTENHSWLFSRKARTVSPASMRRSHLMDSRSDRHGQGRTTKQPGNQEAEEGKDQDHGCRAEPEDRRLA